MAGKLKFGAFLGLKALSTGAAVAATTLIPATCSLSLVALLPALGCNLLSQLTNKTSDQLSDGFDYKNLIDHLKKNGKETPNHDVLKSLRDAIKSGLERLFEDFKKETVNDKRKYLKPIRKIIDTLIKEVDENFEEHFSEEIGELDLKNYLEDKNPDIYPQISEFLNLEKIQNYGNEFSAFFNERFPVYVSFAFTQNIKARGKAWVALQKLYFTQIQDDLSFLKENQIKKEDVVSIENKLEKLFEKVETIESYGGGNIQIDDQVVANIIDKEFQDLKKFNNEFQVQILSSIEFVQQQIEKGFKDLTLRIEESESKILDRIDLLESSLNAVKTFPKFLTITPAKPPAEFLGRDEELEYLKTNLEKDIPFLLINGIGGIGKTTLAAAYYHKHIDDYDHIVWLTVSDNIVSAIVSSGISQSLHIAEIENQEESKKYNEILKALIDLDGKKLFVIDNANDVNDLHENIPNLTGWDLIITSRCQIPEFESLNIKTLKKENAKKLFTKYFEVAEDQNKLLNDLLRQIGYHTLSVELLAKNLQKFRGRNFGLEELYNNLLDKGLLNPDKSKKVGTAYQDKKQGQYEALIGEMYDLNELSENNKTILLHFSLLPPEYISYQDIIDLFTNELLSDDIIDENLDELRDFGWLDERYKNEIISYRIHQVIQEVVRSKVIANEANTKYFLDVLFEKIYCEEKDDPFSKKKYVKYAGYALNHLSHFKSELKAKLYFELSKRNIDFGNYKLALVNNENAKNENYGDPELNIKILAIHANILRLQGHHKDALVANNKALELIKENYNALACAEIYDEMASIYILHGQYDKALVYFEKSKDIRIENLDENHYLVGKSFQELSFTYLKKGEHEKALKHGLTANKINLNYFDKNHIENIRSYQSLANIYKAMNEPEKAIEFGLKALEIAEEILTIYHPVLAETYSLLGNTYRQLEQYDKALNLGLKAIRIWESFYNSNKIYLAASYNSIALTYRKLNETKKALKYILKSVSLLENELEKDNPFLANTYLIAATANFDDNDKKEAQNNIEKSIAIYKNKFDDDHPNLLNAIEWETKIKEMV